MITLALPSKGRLKEESEAFFARIGCAVKTKNSRDYIGTLRGIPNITVLFLQASEITRRLIDGSIDLGITGLDLLEEYKSQEDHVYLLKKLGFGYADLVVAVPQSWIDVDTMSDLDEVAHDIRHKYNYRMRIATKYFNLTNKFFHQNQITDYRLIESAGATESAPNIGTAEIITDITTTGSTLHANHLKILRDGVILKSEALLAVRQKGSWNSQQYEILHALANFIHAYDFAQNISLLRGTSCNITKENLLEILEKYHISDLFFAEGGFSFHAPSDNIYEIISLLQNHHVTTLTVTKPDQVFSLPNPLWENLKKSLDNPF
jgi:ATP phosphoribosyltransferase